MFTTLGPPFFEILVATNNSTIVRVYFLRLEDIRKVSAIVVDINWG
jgi:hypothetical protein